MLLETTVCLTLNVISYVSILVVMENALGVFAFLSSSRYIGMVSILVVMENALGDTKKISVLY